MDKEVLKGLLDHKKIAILKALYFSKEEMYLRELAKKSKVSVSSVFRIVQELVGLGLVRVKEVRMMKFYSLVRDGKEKFLGEWFKEEGMLDLVVRAVSGMEGVSRVLLHGKTDNNMANVILIGSNVDEGRIDEICEKFKEKGFDLSCAVFSERQFEKLNKMGVYGGEKKVLL